MSRISSSKTLRKDTLNIISAPKNYMPQHPMLNSGLHAYHFQEAEPGGEMSLKKTRERQKTGLWRPKKSMNVIKNDMVWNMNRRTIEDNVRDIVQYNLDIAENYIISRVIQYYVSLILDKSSLDQFGRCGLFELEDKINYDWTQIPDREKSRISRTGVYITRARNDRLSR